MKRLYKRILTKIFSAFCLRKTTHGSGCQCNHYCRLTKKTKMGNNCHFNGMRIAGQGRVIIGNNFHSGSDCHMLTSNHDYDHGSALPYGSGFIHKDIVIGDNVWLGSHVLVLGGVEIGEGAVIQAGAVVCKNIPPLAVAGGSPAIPFKQRDEEHYYSLKNAAHQE